MKISAAIESAIEQASISEVNGLLKIDSLKLLVLASCLEGLLQIRIPAELLTKQNFSSRSSVEILIKGILDQIGTH